MFPIGNFEECSKLKGYISIDPNNPTFRTDGTNVYRKDNEREVKVWEKYNLNAGKFIPKNRKEKK